MNVTLASEALAIVNACYGVVAWNEQGEHGPDLTACELPSEDQLASQLAATDDLFTAVRTLVRCATPRGELSIAWLQTRTSSLATDEGLTTELRERAAAFLRADELPTDDLTVAFEN